MKTNKVKNYYDRIFIADIKEVKNKEDMNNIFYDVFTYGDDKKVMYCNINIFKNKVKKLLSIVDNPNDKIFKHLTKYGAFMTVVSLEESEDLLIFVDNRIN